MAVDELVTDVFLQSVLETTVRTREQCIALLDLIDANASENVDIPREAQLQISKQQKLMHSYLARLRGLNRKAVLAVRQTKQETSEARSEVDRLHLQLQNLYYEQRHLLGEIHACESYDHQYQQLPLVPVDEFLAQQDEAFTDENALMVARIEGEHRERQALEDQRQELLKHKLSLIADNEKRKEDLASLDRDLEKFIDAAKPIQKLFEKE